MKTHRCLSVEGNESGVMPESEAADVHSGATGSTEELVTWFDYGEYAIWHLAPQFECLVRRTS